jgi:sterol desaturase/sphingolipid hydroxylase (fatty acid hydroxylase superfamily)
MYGWTEFLTDLGWFGAFVAAAVIALVERRFALFRRAGVARTPNFRFGVVGVVMTVICVVAISEPLTAAAYRLSLFSIADLPLPSFAKIVIGFVFIDLTLYANHIVSHKWSVLWRVHRTHHADPLVTGTTGLLHHPLETLWMFVFLLAVNVMFGVPVGAILIYAADARAAQPDSGIGHGDAGHAPHPPFDGERRMQFELRPDLFVLGPAVRHLHGKACARR